MKNKTIKILLAANLVVMIFLGCTGLAIAEAIKYKHKIAWHTSSGYTNETDDYEYRLHTERFSYDDNVECVYAFGTVGSDSPDGSVACDFSRRKGRKSPTVKLEVENLTTPTTPAR